jgi:hypothetical protein
MELYRAPISLGWMTMNPPRMCSVLGAFGDKNNSVVHNDLMGSFPLILLDGSVCFFVMYNYKANVILATSIAGLDNKSIFNAYENQFDRLTSKGFTPKINILDNQATNHIIAFLMEQQCKLRLVELHNHRMNAAERAIQTFKDTFIAALATADCKFLLQLWDKITLQVQDTLNIMQASRINPAISAYEALNRGLAKCTLFGIVLFKLNILFSHVFLRSLVVILPVPRVRGVYRGLIFFSLVLILCIPVYLGIKGDQFFFDKDFLLAVVLHINWCTRICITCPILPKNVTNLYITNLY